MTIIENIKAHLHRDFCDRSFEIIPLFDKELENVSKRRDFEYGSVDDITDEHDQTIF